ncbi:MAG: YceI family protein [Pseudomonadota bacterium]
MSKSIISALAACLIVGCATAGEQSFTEANSGTYELEKSHAFLTWRVSHNGLSKYTARFTDFDATIAFDPENPVASSVTATVNPMSIETNHPTNENWNTTLATDDKWLNGDEFPEITFQSTGVEQTGEFTGIITGDLTLLGVTKSIQLDATYNGTGNAPWYGTRDLIGFSATGTLKRSDFGMVALLPNIGDEVEIIIEAEFLEAR